jgi:hypothetical protein
MVISHYIPFFAGDISFMGYWPILLSTGIPSTITLSFSPRPKAGVHEMTLCLPTSERKLMMGQLGKKSSISGNLT